MSEQKAFLRELRASDCRESMRELADVQETCTAPVSFDGEMLMCCECLSCIDYIATYWFYAAQRMEYALENTRNAISEALRIAQAVMADLIDGDGADLAGLTATIRRVLDA